MQNIINEYFEDKKIKASVKDVKTSDNYITYIIGLYDIRDLSKFNNKMEKELSFLLKKNVSLNVGNDITLIINNSEAKKNNKKESGVILDIGKNTRGERLYINFKNNPHWLIGGSTGSGKSVFLNNVITQLIKDYGEQIEFGFIDLKQVEFYCYNGLKMNIRNVANDIDEAIRLLDNAINIMNDRYEKYKRNGVLDIDTYNSVSDNKDKYLFVVIDELAELVLQSKKEVLSRLQRLLQLGRASGVYCICATQRPSADVISGVLKVNFTTRICFKVSNMYDSKTIINQKGAELLNGNGDGLVLTNGAFDIVRFQGYSPVNNKEILANNKSVKSFIDNVDWCDVINKTYNVIYVIFNITLAVVWFMLKLCGIFWLVFINIMIWLGVVLKAIFRIR